mmetsp:Transcript_130257/g.225544  ORF Transcript_130257/g.225544 Transcript_130257/m.225544 type:complete len:320 (+) Transcript_130257:114-1073(+)
MQYNKTMRFIVGLTVLSISTAQASILMQYENDAHGTYVGLLCSSATPGFCQLNSHVIFFVSPESLVNTIKVGAEYELDGSGKWMPLAADYEFMMWNASLARLSTGKPARQYKGMVQANIDKKVGLPKKFCARVWARDATTGSVASLPPNCVDILTVEVQVPQTSKLEGRINHAPATFFCDTDENCVFNAHVIISTYAMDPTNDLYGGAEMKLGQSATWQSKGLRMLLQSKPTSGDRKKKDMLGPRVQIAYEARALRRVDVPQQVCFKLWVGDGTTGEVSEVVANDNGEDLPPPVAPGVFCYQTAEVVKDDVASRLPLAV